MGIYDTIKKAFGYDAASDSTRRKALPARLRSEDMELGASARRKLVAGTRDVRRNYTIAAAMIRKHLDFVSDIRFQATTGDKALDTELETLIRRWGNRKNCDAARRHSLRSLFRIAEACRVVDGDVLLYKLSNGSIQVIEGDHIRSSGVQSIPKNLADADKYVHGVRVGNTNAALRYMIADRSDHGGFTYRATLPARQVEHLGYFDRYDQVRGISPLASAVTTLQDTYESLEYAKAKLKVAQLFALAFFRDASEPLGTIDHSGGTDDDGNTAKGGYEVDFSGGPQMLDLDAGDRAEFLESKTPASETQAFFDMLIKLSLHALDIPHVLIDPSGNNFAQVNAAIRQYVRACESKTADLIEVADALTAWRLRLFIEDGDLVLPQGMTLGDVRWEWIPRGEPWWDRSKEVNGDVRAIAAGLDTPQGVCKRTGTDFYDNIDKIAEARAYAEEQGVPLSYTADGPAAPAGVDDE